MASREHRVPAVPRTPSVAGMVLPRASCKLKVWCSARDSSSALGGIDFACIKYLLTNTALVAQPMKDAERTRWLYCRDE